MLTRAIKIGRLGAALAVGITMAVAGCAEPEDAAVAEAAVPGSPLEVETEPRLGVGVLEGDPVQEFESLTTPFMLADGRLVVPIGGDRVIRVFGNEGEHLTDLGGSGEGPGEFRSLGAVWARGDTIEAFDSRLRRVTRFFPGGGIDVIALDSDRPAQAAVPGTLPDGWALVAVADVEMNGRDRMVVHRFDLNGDHAGELAQVGGMMRYSTSQGAGPGPLSPRAVFGVHEGHVYVAETLTPAIQVLDSAGQLTRQIAWEPEGVESPELAFASIVDAAVAREGRGRAESTRQRLEAYPVPDEVSLFWDFIVDDLGFVWVRPYEADQHSIVLGRATGGGSGPGGDWSVFSPEGDRVGSVTMPPTLEPMQITRDAVVGIERDEYGVEFVRVHSLARQ